MRRCTYTDLSALPSLPSHYANSEDWSERDFQLIVHLAGQGCYYIKGKSSKGMTADEIRASHPHFKDLSEVGYLVEAIDRRTKVKAFALRDESLIVYALSWLAKGATPSGGAIPFRIRAQTKIYLRQIGTRLRL